MSLHDPDLESGTKFRTEHPILGFRTKIIFVMSQIPKVELDSRQNLQFKDYELILVLHFLDPENGTKFKTVQTISEFRTKIVPLCPIMSQMPKEKLDSGRDIKFLYSGQNL